MNHFFLHFYIRFVQIYGPKRHISAHRNLQTRTTTPTHHAHCHVHSQMIFNQAHLIHITPSLELQTLSNQSRCCLTLPSLIVCISDLIYDFDSRFGFVCTVYNILFKLHLHFQLVPHTK